MRQHDLVKTVPELSTIADTLPKDTCRLCRRPVHCRHGGPVPHQPCHPVPGGRRSPAPVCGQRRRWLCHLCAPDRGHRRQQPQHFLQDPPHQALRSAGGHHSVAAKYPGLAVGGLVPGCCVLETSTAEGPLQRHALPTSSDTIATPVLASLPTQVCGPDCRSASLGGLGVCLNCMAHTAAPL